MTEYNSKLSKLLEEIKIQVEDSIERYKSSIEENDKSSFRNAYIPKKNDYLNSLRKGIERRNFNRAIDFFVTGKEVIPEKINPELIEVESKGITSDVFKLATSFWSVPPSPGYGRRIRFLVIDKQNNRLIGIFAIGDPVISLKARDSWIGWDQKQKHKRLSSIMDGYVIGSVPPYNYLLGGKLITSLIASKEVSESFYNKYANKESEYKQTRESSGTKSNGLALVTISSALGKSSIYNRVRLGDNVNLLKTGTKQNKIDPGFSLGFGHFHITNEIYKSIIEYFKITNNPIYSANRFGDGANFKIRVISEFFRIAEINRDKLKHNVKREIFVMPLAKNYKEYLIGKDNKLIKRNSSVNEISEMALGRWIIPRSKRIIESKLNLYKPTDWVEDNIYKSFNWYGINNLKLFR